MTVWADITSGFNEQTVLTPPSRPSSPSARDSSPKPSARRKKTPLHSHSSQPVYTSVNPSLYLASAHSFTHSRSTHQSGSCPRCIGCNNRKYAQSPSNGALQEIDFELPSFEKIGYDNQDRRNCFTETRNLRMLHTPSSSKMPYPPPSSSSSWSTLLGYNGGGSSG
jgi:hypothetical protein